MSLTEFADALPEYARDLRLNIAALLGDPRLDDQQKYGVFLACAHATGYRPIAAAAESDAAERLSDAAAEAARTSAALMGMTNVYYRFVHLASNKAYGQLPAKLRMNLLGSHGIDKADYELFALAVSAMNGCGMCIDSHEKILRQHQVPAETVQTAVRIAAVVHAAAKVHATAVEAPAA